MKNFTNQEYNYLAKDVVHDAFESNISYRGRIAKERQYAEIIIRKILDINPEEQITLGNPRGNDPMKLTILMDNNTYIDQYYLGEPAFSVYIEDGAEKILFDTGYSDAFLRNAEQMQVDMNALRMSRHKTVSGIIGGFHLLKKNQQLTETIRFLDHYTNGMLYPCHCVSFAAKHEMMNTLPLTEVGVGLELEVE